MSNMSNSIKFRSHQRGAVLIVGLMVVLLTGVLSLAAIRGSGLQESMAGNMRNRNMAFQAAESAIREGELFVLNTTPMPTFNGNGRFTARPPASSILLYTEANWKTPNLVISTAYNLGEVNGVGALAANPAYVLEELDSDSTREAASTGSSIESEAANLNVYYRVTARGVGVTSDSVVVLQSNVKALNQ